MSTHVFGFNRCVYCGEMMSTGNCNDPCPASPAAQPKPTRIPIASLTECASYEQPSQPAGGAREFMDKYTDDARYDPWTLDEIYEFAEAYAKKERERADAAERRVKEFEQNSCGVSHAATDAAIPSLAHSSFLGTQPTRVSNVETAGQSSPQDLVESLRTELAEAKQKHATLVSAVGSADCKPTCDSYGHDDACENAVVTNRLVTLERELRDMREALEKYGKHSMECTWWMAWGDKDRQCDCGLEDLLSRKGEGS